MDKNTKVNIDLHLHTNITDGEITAQQVIEESIHLKIKTIAFTEHIDKNPTYNWYTFYNDIKRINHKNLKVFIGTEAKVLDTQGTLNIPNDVLKDSDIVLGAVHGEGDVIWLLKSNCDIIAHPPINNNNLSMFLNCKKILEINPKDKYRLEDQILEKLIESGCIFSFGSNTHLLTDISEGQEYFSKVLNKYPNIKVIGINHPIPDFKKIRSE